MGCSTTSKNPANPEQVFHLCAGHSGGLADWQLLAPLIAESRPFTRLDLWVGHHILL